MTLFDVYPLMDVTIAKGKGCTIWDSEGQEYLDLYGGHAVISVGHCHPHYVEAMTKQLQTLGFYSNSPCRTRYNGSSQTPGQGLRIRGLPALPRQQRLRLEYPIW